MQQDIVYASLNADWFGEFSDNNMMLGFFSSQDSFWRFGDSSCMLLNKWATTVRAETEEIISDGKLYLIETNDDQDFTNIQWPCQELTDWRYPAYVSPIFQGYVRGISWISTQNVAKHMVRTYQPIYWIQVNSQSELNISAGGCEAASHWPIWTQLGLVANMTSHKQNIRRHP